jgi:phospholipid transport system substrate-binding protein
MRTLIASLLLVAGLVPISSAHAADASPAATTKPAATAPAAAPAASAQGPQELMESVAQSLLNELEQNRETLRNDPAALRAVVDRHLLPHFDTDYAGQLVLGRHWRQASPAQRKRFVDAFYQSLMRNYGEALLEFTADRMKILPFKGDPNASSATVRTEVRRDNGTLVPVNYSLRKTPSGWKAWDVTIEGISYVKNYRNDIGAEVAQKGLDSVIQRLEAQNAAGKPGDAPGTTPTKSG